jgi:hypothetical protein
VKVLTVVGQVRWDEWDLQSEDSIPQKHKRICEKTKEKRRWEGKKQEGWTESAVRVDNRRIGVGRWEKGEKEKKREGGNKCKHMRADTSTTARETRKGASESMRKRGGAQPHMEKCL